MSCLPAERISPVVWVDLDKPGVPQQLPLGLLVRDEEGAGERRRYASRPGCLGDVSIGPHTTSVCGTLQGASTGQACH